MDAHGPLNGSASFPRWMWSELNELLNTIPNGLPDPPPGEYDDTLVLEDLPIQTAAKIQARVSFLSRQGTRTAEAADRFVKSLR